MFIRRSVVLALFACIALPMLPAHAQYVFPEGDEPAIQGRVQAGRTIVISGGGFRPGSTVRCEINGQVVATATVSAEGTFFCEVTVPSGLGGRRVTIRAVGIDPSGRPKVQTTTVNVLAATGGETRTVLYIALAAILAGGLLFALGRRRGVVRA